MSRKVVKVFENKEQAEGVGARVRRSIGTHEVIFLEFFGNLFYLGITVRFCFCSSSFATWTRF